jgi:hypothetical protein
MSYRIRAINQAENHACFSKVLAQETNTALFEDKLLELFFLTRPSGAPAA